ncbi:MAG: hypothetical protein RLZZ227_2226 [Pseudomonadota bacterium]
MLSSRGYTLMELLFVITIVGFLAAMTVPSFQDTILRNAREAAMNDLVTALSATRTEAVTQARKVSICRSINQATCAGGSGGADWYAGWIIFSDAGTAGTLDGADVLLQVRGPGSAGLRMTLKTRANGNFTGDYLRFDEEGFLNNSTTGAYFKVCQTENVAADARALWLSNTGRPAMSTTGANTVHNDLAGADLVCP